MAHVHCERKRRNHNNHAFRRPNHERQRHRLRYRNRNPHARHRHHADRRIPQRIAGRLAARGLESRTRRQHPHAGRTQTMRVCIADPSRLRRTAKRRDRGRRDQRTRRAGQRILRPAHHGFLERRRRRLGSTDFADRATTKEPSTLRPAPNAANETTGRSKSKRTATKTPRRHAANETATTF